MAREFITLDTRVDVLKNTFNSLTNKVGDLENLTTTGDSDLVQAINEHDTELGTITAGAMGTTASTVSTAIKELDSDRDRLVTYTGMPVAITGMDNSSTNVLSTAVLNLDSALGNRTSLNTKNSSTFVAAINEIHDSIGEVLMTTTATTIKGSINEHDAELGTISAGAMGTTASTVSTAIAELDSRLDSIGNTQLISPKLIASDSASTTVLRGNLQVDTHAKFRQRLTADSAQITNDFRVGGVTTMSGNLVLGSNDINDVANVHVRDAIIHDGDTNTTVNFGTDQINLKTGGTDRVKVTDTDTHFTHAIRVNDSAYVVGNFDVGGDVDIAGTLTVDGVVNFKAGSSGSITLGDANTDNVVFTADVNSHIIPNTDATYDLGSSVQEWNHGFFDGTVNADRLLADSATVSGNLTVSGQITGNASTATVGTNVTATANDSANETTHLAFVDGQSGTQGIETAYRLQYRPSTHMLHANVTGNLTGNVVGSVTGAQTGITSLGTLSALQVGSIALTNTTISTVGGTDLNITPVAGQQIVLDGNIEIDGDQVTGAGSITSDFFVGKLDADSADARTLTAHSISTGAAGSITSGSISVGGKTLAESIADTVGDMVGSNTETNISVTYDDTDNTLDFVVNNISGTAGVATAITVADEASDTTCFPLFSPAATGNINPKSHTNLKFNSSTGLLTATNMTAGTFNGALSGNVTGTIQTAAQGNITSLGTLTTLTVDNVKINGTQIGHTSDTDLITLSSGIVTVAGELDATSLDIGTGGADINGLLEADSVTIAGVGLSTYISDVVGGMVTNNTETNIAVTHDTVTDTLDFIISAIPATVVSDGNLGAGVELKMHADNTASAFKVPFIGSTSNADINAELRHSSAGNFEYNPSTDVLSVGTITGDSAEIDNLIFQAGYSKVNGVPLQEYIEDVAGSMWTGNYENGITISYEDGTGDIDASVAINNAHWSGTDLAVVNGGTGSGTASGARTNLGLGTLATLSTVNNAQWSGTDLAVVNGGTGSGTASGARTNLGLGSLATLSTVSNSNWSGTDLAVANGGTGASTADGARDALDVQVYIEAESAGTPSAADFTNNNAILVVQY